MQDHRAASLLDVERLLEDGDWYDLWHTHTDWHGDGNRGPEARRPFLNELFQLFERVGLHVRTWSTAVQIWVVIVEADSSQDAVYVHTANPNRSNFPYTFDGVLWGTELPEWLRDFVDTNRHEFGRCEFNGILTYWVREKE